MFNKLFIFLHLNLHWVYITTNKLTILMDYNFHEFYYANNSSEIIPQKKCLNEDKQKNVP